ncbi:hypothetical protein EYF80_059320 [Liparis tanakae]|uniref:Uncharacterized protein n=1 Tax=Liparis tanakae TaxID=230148 RepID=A0A4Z2EP43_9TELE|nr:hypothetical protein EYF80_059320 [Liparis tanakae]
MRKRNEAKEIAAWRGAARCRTRTGAETVTHVRRTQRSICYRQYVDVRLKRSSRKGGGGWEQRFTSERTETSVTAPDQKMMQLRSLSGGEEEER